MKMQPDSLRKDACGLTLLEVLIAMIVLSIVLLTSLFAINSGWIGAEKSIRQNDAAMMVGEQVEMMKFRIAKDPANNFAPHDSTAVAVNGITVSWKVNAGSPADSVRSVTFKAKWRKGKLMDSLVVPTYIARNY